MVRLVLNSMMKSKGVSEAIIRWTMWRSLSEFPFPSLIFTWHHWLEEKGGRKRAGESKMNKRHKNQSNHGALISAHSLPPLDYLHFSHGISVHCSLCFVNILIYCVILTAHIKPPTAASPDGTLTLTISPRFIYARIFFQNKKTEVNSVRRLCLHFIGNILRASLSAVIL